MGGAGRGYGREVPAVEREHTEVTRRALREVAAALALSATLMAVLLAVLALAGRGPALAFGALAMVTTVAVALVVRERSSAALAARNRLLEQELRGRGQLDRTLAATRELVQVDSADVLRRRICETARDVFECTAVSLWEVDGSEMRLLERVPLEPPFTGADRRDVAELPGLADALRAGEPLFVADLQATATGLTRATAEIAGTRSLLNVPVASSGVSRLDLVLTWREVIERPGPTQQLAVQRFADQAGLALEQSRLRTAQGEIASLNRTLSRMVQADPLFRAGGSAQEVARAICAEAREVFEATGAALWVEADDGIELVRRVPEVAMFRPKLHIPFGEHPSFAEDLAAGRPHFVADVEQEDPVLWERFARHSGSRSQLRLPLASAGQARLLIVLSWADAVAPPSAEVSAIASRFADQAGIAMAEAQRREADAEASALHARFAESLLPTIALEQVATLYRPGDERMRLGGDFYDCLALEDGSLALLVGDVAGHGPAAAALGASLRSAWRALVLAGWRLEDLPGGLQRVCVCEREDPYMFVTALCGAVDAARRELRVLSAGHPEPIVLGGGDTRVEHGPPLGVVRAPEWPVVTTPLARADTVVLYTDGLVEGRASPGAAERLGLGPLRERLASSSPGAVGEGDLRALVDLATQANGAGLADDVAILAVNTRHA